MATEFIQQILEKARAAGLTLSERQAELCRIHIDLMLEWNRRLNLTRITAPEEIIVKHLLDSILPAGALPRSGRALDVGAGAGFPGIPLKIFSPDLDMVLLDSSRKKASFLSVATAKLGLKGIRSVHGRWEEFAGKAPNRNAYQLISMRAVRLEESHLSVLAAGLLGPGGIFAWWGGPESEKTADELAATDFSTLQRGALSYTLPGIARPRSVWTWKKPSEPPSSP